jgi:hypothetical protein
MKNNIKNNCEQFSNELWLYLDEALPKDKLEMWKEHLTTCSNCSAELKKAEDTIALYEKVPLEDIDNQTYKMMINTTAATSLSSANNNVGKYTTRSRSFSQMFGFYKLAFGGGLLAAAILLIFITFFNNPKIPVITKQIPQEFLHWDGPSLSDRTPPLEDGIISLKTDDWDVYIVKKNNTEEWNAALRAIQKQIIKMRKEVSSTSM